MEKIGIKSPSVKKGPEAGNLSLINGVIGSVAYKSGPSDIEGLGELIFPLSQNGRSVKGGFF